MSKFFLDPRDRYFDSASSISFKSSTNFTSESRISQGLLRLNSVFWEKSKKQACFISWRSITQGSLYRLWKEVFQDHPHMQEFETVLKILHKRKTKVDELWGMLKTEEIKYEELLVTNQKLESRVKNLQDQVKVYSDQAVQVNFLQDSALRKTHDELSKLSSTLSTKQLHLSNLEQMLTSKFDQLILREKSLHQKELSTLLFTSPNPTSPWESSLKTFKSSIFPFPIDGDFWLQVAESVQITPSQIKSLQIYEEKLFKKFSKVRTKPEKKTRALENCPLKISENIDCSSIEYLKLGLNELRDIQKQSHKDEALIDELLITVVKFTEGLISREEEFVRVSTAKNEYLELARNELTQMKKMLKVEEELMQKTNEVDEGQVLRRVSEVETQFLQQLQETVVEKQACQLEKMVFEVQEEEVKVKEVQLENEIRQYERLNSELVSKNQEIDKRVFEFKSVLQLLLKVNSGNVEIFRQEISKIVFEHEQNPEVTKSLKLVMSLYLWLTSSYIQAQGKDMLRVKLTFYLLRIRVLMLKKGFSIAPVHFSTPQDCLWLEIFWLRARHYYFYDIYTNAALVSFTKQWFFKFIVKKMQFAFEVLEKSRHRITSHCFYILRNKTVQLEQLRTQRLYSQLVRIEDKSCLEIKKEINAKCVKDVLPIFQKFDRVWAMNLKVFLLRWRNFSEKRENEYYRRTIFEIYSSMSELMIKEYKFKEECRATQNELRGKIYESGKLLDKILL